MSLEQATTRTLPTKTTLAPAPSKKRSHSEYLRDINARFKRLTEDVFPHHPYLLTIPSEKPYRLGSRAIVANWAVGEGCLFAPEEDQLQYMTFLSRQTDDTLLVAVGGWSDKNGNLVVEDEPLESGVKMSHSLSQSSLQKKKISFNDYKKKTLEGPVASTPASGKSDTLPPPRDLEKSPAPRSVNSKHNSTSKDGIRSKRPEKPSIRDDDIPRKRLKQPTSKPDSNNSKSHTHPPRREDSDSDKSSTNQRNVPRLLSPTLPTVPRSPRKIPSLLSPTLPSWLDEQTLDDSLLSQTTIPSPFRNESVPPASKTKEIQATADELAKGKRLKPPSSTAESKTAAKKPAAPPSPESRPLKKVSAQANSNHLSPAAANSIPPTPAKSKLVVKLKYGRQNRKRVEALLKMAKRKPPAEKSLASQRSKESIKEQKLVDSLAPKPAAKQREPSSGFKRPQPVDEAPIDTPPVKKPRVIVNAPSDTLQVPTNNSRAADQQSRNRTTATKKVPKLISAKDVSMRRTESTDGEQRLSGAGTKNSQDEKPANGPSPALSADNVSAKSPDPEWRAWRDEWKKLFALGRELKHECEPQLEPGKSTGNGLKAVMAIESLLCFTLAFIADDKWKFMSRQTVNSTNWWTLIPYWQAVTGRAAPYPHLQGLCMFMGSLINEAVHTLDLDSLAAISLPGSSGKSKNSSQKVAQTPGSDDTDSNSQPMVLTQDSQAVRDLIELRKRLLDTHREARRLWLDACRLLPDVALAREYPETWQQRSRNFFGRGKIAVKPGKYAGDFFLPLARSGGMAPGTGTTGVIEGIRFAYAFLREWCDKEEVKWINKLKL